jgi:nucleoside-diphosphate-sugar epimerase
VPPDRRLRQIQRATRRRQAARPQHFEKRPIRTALVLGITGGIGGEVARALLARGWHVRALHRNPHKAAVAAAEIGASIEWIKGDAMSGDYVTAAATGADVIVHAVNPPKYHNWAGLVLPMLDNTIAAAKVSGARILFPGTIKTSAPTPSGRSSPNAQRRTRSLAKVASVSRWSADSKLQ